jgi:hypothetical protein
MIPGLLPSESRSGSMSALWQFHQDVLRPRFDSGTYAGSSLLRKMAVKAEGRWWTVSLGNHRASDRRTARARPDVGTSNHEVLHSFDHRIWKRQEAEEDQNFEPPRGFEEQIQSLVDNLSDKVGSSRYDVAWRFFQAILMLVLQDTIVRYSAAKYIARTAALLPSDWSAQIVEAIIQLYEGTDTEPVVETAQGRILEPGGGSRGDARWHGVCLALAETARRGLIDQERLGEMLPWVLKVGERRRIDCLSRLSNHIVDRHCHSISGEGRIPLDRMYAIVQPT